MTYKYNIDCTNLESYWVKLFNVKDNKKYVVEVAYRHPSGSSEQFIDALDSNLSELTIKSQ